MLPNKKRLTLKPILDTRAFTLIELLIVVVVIGILAGISISIINPGKQQGKARDGVTKAAISKMVLATNSFISAYGFAPDGVAFSASIDSLNKKRHCGLPRGNLAYCDFTLTGVSLPKACNSGHIYPITSGTKYDCWFRYYGGSSGKFYIRGASWGVPGKDFRYYSYSGGGIVEKAIELYPL